MSSEEIAKIVVEFFNEVESACFNAKNKIAQLYLATNAEKTAAPAKSESTDSGSDLSKLPWRSYATKQPAGPDEAAWVFSDTKGAEALLATLKSKNGKATLGNLTYTLQGSERQFIARTKTKQGS
jgi:hypothetical protein